MTGLPEKASPSPEFDSARLHFRLATSGDIALLVGLDADPAVMRYITGGSPSTEADVAQVLADPNRHLWIATRRVDYGFVGWFSLRHSRPRELEIGYRLATAWWGQGLATEGAASLLELASGEMNASRVWAQTMTANAASRAVMERLGMVFVRSFFIDGLEPIDGSELGDVEYEIIVDE